MIVALTDKTYRKPFFKMDDVT